MAIVSSRNDSINEIYKMIIEEVPGDFKWYKSIDIVCNIEDAVLIRIFKFPQSCRLAFLRTEVLTKLKIGTPIMLKRNLNSPSMCNGTTFLIDF